MSPEQHELIVALKDLAIELGRTPIKSEFMNSVQGGHYKVLTLFKTYSALVAAAGLDTYNNRRSPKAVERITNKVFNTSIENHLRGYEQQVPVIIQPYPTAAVISDIHWPFSCQRVIDAFMGYVKEHQPEWVILNGDAWDMYSHSKYPRSHNVFTPREEQTLARAANEDFWKRVKEASPTSKCIQLMGNHDVRPLKRMLESYPAAEDWIEEKLKELFSFTGVSTVMDPREEIYLREDLIVFHGYRTQLGAHRDFTLLNCINGHTHRGGVVWRTIRGGCLFEANSGLAGDPESKGLSYTPQKIKEWTPGFLGMDKYGPRFIPA